jgi:serine phosphatase RsbU (regulator of sigma subunit)
VADRVLVTIGDVQGHSLQAATVMGELRHALRAFASEGHSPLTITGLVNDVLRRYHPGILATLCLGLLDPATGELQIVNCGHMPILVVEGPNAAYLGQGGLILGMPMHDPHAETTFLPADGTALLITDGLVEDRRVLLDGEPGEVAYRCPGCRQRRGRGFHQPPDVHLRGQGKTTSPWSRCEEPARAH